jgi:hypothetical protein
LWKGGRKRKHSALSRQHSAKELNRNGRKVRKELKTTLRLPLRSSRPFAVNGLADG